jgi:hypothetical protein
MTFDAASQLVLAWDRKTHRFQDKTLDIVSMEFDGGQYAVRYRNTRYPFRYNPENIVVAEPGESRDVGADELIEVDGKPWTNAARLEFFSTRAGAWTRVHYPTAAGPAFRSYPAGRVRAMTNARLQPRVERLMGYFGDVVAALLEGDPLKKSYERLGFVHPASALATYLAGDRIPSKAGPRELIFPFSSNLSQREALSQALSHQISVIEGPPGTGKTQTILNLIANIVRDPRATVGVVSFGNAAVDNVYDKLQKEGFGFIAAPLGSMAKHAQFFEGQDARNAALTAFLASPTTVHHDDVQLARLSEKVHRVYVLERAQAQFRASIAELEREREVFAARFPPRNGGPRLPRASARWGSARLLELLAEIELQQFRHSRAARVRWSFRRRWRYRLTATTKEHDPLFAVEVQRHYFDVRIRECHQRLTRCDIELTSPGLAQVRQEMELVSSEILTETVARRYRDRTAAMYSDDSLWKQRDEFQRDYPVLLSTCHSLPGNVGASRLLDYLIIDEASQVNLAIAVLAMSVARCVIVVGDTRQLPHIAADIGGIGVEGELAAYDYGQHNVLSSLLGVYGEALPRTMLREHYRCDPRIIDFCNRKFYGGRLIPMRQEGPGSALAMVRTAPGQHSRAHAEGGHTNQRELDVVVDEALPEYCGDFPASEVGVITPFRKQADLIMERLPGIEADTVHKFQGREKAAIVMSTVIDTSQSGTRLATFVDNPHLINVAVSRAQSRFVLVANPDLPEECQNLRDLVGYVEQRSPGHVLRSEIVSVFDILYTEYADVLKSMASHLPGVTPYRSEEAVLVTLEDLLDSDEFRHLRLSYQVPLQHLLAGTAVLTPDELSFVRHRASVDFVISNRTTDQVLGVIEVDGFTYHQDNPDQLRRDALKDAILARQGIALLRLPTTGSGETARIRGYLAALAGPMAAHGTHVS